jgi:hypothetical protein
MAGCLPLWPSTHCLSLTVGSGGMGTGGGGHDIHFGLFKAPTDGVYESSKHTTDFMCHSMDWAAPVRLPGRANSAEIRQGNQAGAASVSVGELNGLGRFRGTARNQAPSPAAAAIAAVAASRPLGVRERRLQPLTRLSGDQGQHGAGPGLRPRRWHARHGAEVRLLCGRAPPPPPSLHMVR